MHSRFPFALLSLSALASLAPAQIAPIDDGKEGMALSALPEIPETYEASWWGRAGRTYFLLRSTDLLTWEYFPVIETGNNAWISYGFTSATPNIFVRLRYEDASYADPYALDSDGDGFTNQQELVLKTDPFEADSDGDGLLDKWESDHGFAPLDSATGADSDGDGLPDVWENCYFLNLIRDGSGYFDGDVINDRQEFLLGTRPDDAAVISASLGLSVRSPE